MTSKQERVVKFVNNTAWMVRHSCAENREGDRCVAGDGLAKRRIDVTLIHHNERGEFSSVLETCKVGKKPFAKCQPLREKTFKVEQFSHLATQHME